MPGTVSHVLTATTPDDLAYEIRPSHWNSSHAFTFQATGSEISGAFSNTNNISFGLSAGAVTASFNSTLLAGTGFTSTTTAGTAVVGTHNSAGLSLGVPAFLTTAMQSNAVTLSNIKVSAGTQSSNLSALTFSNGSGVSFGLDNGTITASVNAAGGGLTNINVSAGTTSNNLSALTFSNANGVSFGLNGSTITASITPGAAQSAIEGFGVSNTGNTAGNTGISTGIDWILAGSGSITLSQSTAANSATIYIQHPAWLTTAMLSNAVTLSNIKVSAGTTSNNLSAITFSNSNNVSFGLNGSTVTGSFALNVSAGTTSNNLSALTWSNANGVSFGLNASTLTASVDATSSVVAGSNVSISTNGSTVTINAALSISAGTTNDSLYQVVFSNSNNVSFGLNGSTITASASVQTLGMYVVSQSTAQSSSSTIDARSFSIAGKGIISAGMSGGSLVISATAGGAQSAIEGFGVSNTGNTAGNTGISTGIDWILAGSGSITLSQSTAANSATVWIQHPAWLTTAMASNAATVSSAIRGLGVSNTGQTAGNTGISTGIDWVLAGSQSITLSQSTAGGGPNTVWFQHPAWLTTAAVSTVGLYAVGNTTSNSSTTLNPQTLSVNGLGGATVGYQAGSLIISAPVSTEGYYAVGNTTSNSSTTLDPRTLSFNGLGAATVGFQAGSVLISAPASSSLVGTQGVSISSNGSTISAMLETVNYAIFPKDAALNNITAPGNGSMSIQYIQNERRITATRLDALFNWSAGSSATTNTMAIALTAIAGIYTLNGSTLSSVSSATTQTTHSYASNTAGTAFTANFTAIRPISVPINIDMKPGNYYVAFGWSSSASSVGASTTNIGQTQSVIGMSGSITGTNYAEFGAATATSKGLFQGLGGMGVYSAALSTVPPTISLSAINQTGSALSAANIALVFRG